MLISYIVSVSSCALPVPISMPLRCQQSGLGLKVQELCNQLSSQTRSVCNVFLSFQARRSTALQHALSYTKLTRPHKSTPWTKQIHTFKERNRTERIIDFTGSSSTMALPDTRNFLLDKVRYISTHSTLNPQHRLYNQSYGTNAVQDTSHSSRYKTSAEMIKASCCWVCYSRITRPEQTVHLLWSSKRLQKKMHLTDHLPVAFAL